MSASLATEAVPPDCWQPGWDDSPRRHKSQRRGRRGYQQFRDEEPIASEPPSQAEGQPAPPAEGQAVAPPAPRQLSFLGLVVLIFYNVSGGPFGSEQAVRAAGPLYTLTGFMIFPVVWSLPQALLTAELATTFPDDAGYVTWVTAAFGPFWGFLEGVLALICGATDNAVYPALFVAYLKYTFCEGSPGKDVEEAACPSLDGQLHWLLPSYHQLIVYLSSGALSYFNWRGLELVGRLAIGLTVFMLLPFGALVVISLPRLTPSKWLDTKPIGAHIHRHGWAGRGRARPHGGLGRPVRYDWMTYMNVLFWNLNYWDSVSTLAGEVVEPCKSFPRALRWAVGLVVATYMLPLAACIAGLPPGQAWDAGFFVEAGRLLGGGWLEGWIVAAAAVSSVGQFLSVQAGNTYLLLGMAELGLLPSCFAVRTRHGAPALGILLSFVVVIWLSSYDVVDLVGMLNGVYCLAQLIEFAAFLELRRRLPALQRPYRVPLGLVGSALMLVGPFAMCGLLLLLPYREEDWKTAAFVATSPGVATLLYAATACWRAARPGSFLREPPTRLEAPVAEPAAAEAAGLPVAPTTLGKSVQEGDGAVR